MFFRYYHIAIILFYKEINLKLQYNPTVIHTALPTFI